MKIIDNIHDVNIPKWNALLKASSTPSVFQTPEYYKLCSTTYGLSSDLFILECDGNYLASVVVVFYQESGLLSFFSRRAIVHGGIVLSSQLSEEGLLLLLQRVVVVCKHKAIYLEFRNYFDYSVYKTIFSSIGLDYMPWLNVEMEVDLKLPIDHSVHPTKRRQINRAFRNGVSMREATSKVDIDAFYALLLSLYRTKVKKPLPKVEHFHDLHKSGMASCILILKGGIAIGGVMCLLSEVNRTVYEYYICGKDKDYPNLYPSIMAMYAMMNLARELDYVRIDLMGAGQARIANGIRDFKLKFGGDKVEYGRFLYVCQPLLYRLGSFYINLKQGLKR